MRSALAALLIAAIPFPGQHSAHPKYWPAVHRWVTNYSPYSYGGEIHGLISDTAGGVWFGDYNSLEHIDAAGRMSQYLMPEWLWEIYGFARDRFGRLWFSLGQSGRIGTIDSNGTLYTRIVVPRRFMPDLREIAFDSGGNLWFMDFGRRSVGVLSAQGVLREQPVNDSYSTHLILRNDRPYLAYYSERDAELSVQMQPFSESRLAPAGKLVPLQLGPQWLSRTPIGDTGEIAATVTSPNGDVWLALNSGNAPLAITRLSLHP
jgi:streptogramin lyase